MAGPTLILEQQAFAELNLAANLLGKFPVMGRHTRAMLCSSFKRKSNS